MNDEKKLSQYELRRLYDLLEKALGYIGEDLSGEDLTWSQEKKARYFVSANAMQEFCLNAGLEDEPEGLDAKEAELLHEIENGAQEADKLLLELRGGNL